MRWPKLRELKEAVTVIFSPRFTTRFPAEPCQVPESFRGKPEFQTEHCIGCGACVNVCPTEALTMVDITDTEPAKRIITKRYDACIFCGNCEDGCTTQKGIKLTDQWDLATLDREETKSTYEFELQQCENCNAVIGTKKHMVWMARQLGPLAYTNPSLLLVRNAEMFGQNESEQKHLAEQKSSEPQTRDFSKILCPKCKCELNIHL